MNKSVIKANKITHWNTRVLAIENDGEVEFGVFEVYYEGDMPISYTENAPGCFGIDLQDLILDINKKREALEKPILWYGERFPEEYEIKS